MSPQYLVIPLVYGFHFFSVTSSTEKPQFAFLITNISSNKLYYSHLQQELYFASPCYIIKHVYPLKSWQLFTAVSIWNMLPQNHPGYWMPSSCPIITPLSKLHNHSSETHSFLCHHFLWSIYCYPILCHYTFIYVIGPNENKGKISIKRCVYCKMLRMLRTVSIR